MYVLNCCETKGDQYDIRDLEDRGPPKGAGA